MRFAGWIDPIISPGSQVGRCGIRPGSTPFPPASQIWMRLDPIVLRRLLRTPRFLTVALLILGLGIGATTALFSVLHSVLLSPLPYEDPEQLVFVWETRDGGSRTTSVSLGNFEAWRASASGDQALAAARWGHSTSRVATDPIGWRVWKRLRVSLRSSAKRCSTAGSSCPKMNGRVRRPSVW